MGHNQPIFLVAIAAIVAIVIVVVAVIAIPIVLPILLLIIVITVIEIQLLVTKLLKFERERETLLLPSHLLVYIILFLMIIVVDSKIVIFIINFLYLKVLKSIQIFLLKRKQSFNASIKYAFLLENNFVCKISLNRYKKFAMEIGGAGMLG